MLRDVWTLSVLMVAVANMVLGFVNILGGDVDQATLHMVTAFGLYSLVKE